MEVSGDEIGSTRLDVPITLGMKRKMFSCFSMTWWSLPAVPFILASPLTITCCTFDPGSETSSRSSSVFPFRLPVPPMSGQQHERPNIPVRIALPLRGNVFGECGRSTIQ